MTRRTVRVLDEFYRSLDAVLPPERPGDGGPSAHEFLTYDVTAVTEALATDYVGVTVPLTDHPSVRTYIGVGIVVPRFAITTALAYDDAVLLQRLRLDVSFD